MARIGRIEYCSVYATSVGTSKKEEGRERGGEGAGSWWEEEEQESEMVEWTA